MNDLKEAQVELRKVVLVKIGDELLFSPDIEAITGPDSDFFEKYDGMKAKVLGFEEHDISAFARVLASTVKAEEPEQFIGRFFVEFENGDKPEYSLACTHFVVP